MPNKYINNHSYAATGYVLSGVFSSVTIGPLGSIGGVGLLGGTKTAYAILNLGRIAATTPGASGINLQAGGTVTNGSTTDTTALIAGAVGTAGAVITGTTVTG